MIDISLAFYSQMRLDISDAQAIEGEIKKKIDDCVTKRGGKIIYSGRFISGEVRFQTTASFPKKFEGFYMIPWWPSVWLLYHDQAIPLAGLEEMLAYFRALGWMCWVFKELDPPTCSLIEEFATRMVEFQSAKDQAPTDAKDFYTLNPIFSATLAHTLLEEATSLARLRPKEFERLLCEIFQSDGYSAVRTMSTLDSQVGDIFLFEKTKHFHHHLVVEAKHYAADRRVGLSAVKQLWYGVEKSGAVAGILATTTKFTTTVYAAREQKKWRLHLLDGDWLVNWLREFSATYGEARALFFNYTETGFTFRTGNI